MTGSFARIDLAGRDLAFRLRRRLFGEKSLLDVADKVWDIAPGETVRYQRSIALPGQFEKIRSVEENTSWEIEKARANGETFEKPPVRAWRFSNAALYKGAIYAGGRERRILPLEANPPPSKNYPVLDINEGALAGSWLGLRYFGHWLTDDAPLALLAEQYGEPISPTPPDWHKGVHRENHVDAYVRYFGLNWRSAENVRFKSLVLFHDEEVTTHKAARMRTLRERVQEKRGSAPARKGVFIMRGVRDASPRAFLNEEEVAETLAREGYDIVEPARATVEEIADAIYGAEMVVTMEGSQINHAVYFADEHAGFLAITPPDRFNSTTKHRVELLGMRYGYLTGDPSGGGFTANIDDLRRTIDLFGREGARA